MKNVVSIMQKSYTLENGASMWQTPPDYSSSTKINFEFVEKLPCWELEIKAANVQYIILAHVTEATRYPHMVQWSSWVAAEKGWRENILFSIEELNEEEYNKLRAVDQQKQLQLQQEQKPEFQQGIVITIRS